MKRSAFRSDKRRGLRVIPNALLSKLFDSVMIPPEVEREFGSKFDWLKVENLESSLLIAALEMIVDAGEAGE